MLVSTLRFSVIISCQLPLLNHSRILSCSYKSKSQVAMSQAEGSLLSKGSRISVITWYKATRKTLHAAYYMLVSMSI